jgi:hypothetical protein
MISWTDRGVSFDGCFLLLENHTKFAKTWLWVWEERNVKRIVKLRRQKIMLLGNYASDEKKGGISCAKAS